MTTNHEPAKTVVVDEWLVDAETGEIVGNASFKPEFSVTDLSSAEWVLEKLQLAEAEIAKQEVLLAARSKAIKEIIGVQDRRKAWLLGKYGPQLQEFCKQAIKDRKERHVKTGFGRLEFGKTRGSISVQDGQIDAALAWAAEHCPEAIKRVESILVKPLQPIASSLPTDLFQVKEGGEDVFSIDVGI